MLLISPYLPPNREHETYLHHALLQYTLLLVTSDDWGWSTKIPQPPPCSPVHASSYHSRYLGMVHQGSPQKTSTGNPKLPTPMIFYSTRLFLPLPMLQDGSPRLLQKPYPETIYLPCSPTLHFLTHHMLRDGSPEHPRRDPPPYLF